MSHPSERFIGLSSCMFAFALAHNKWMANPKNSRFSQPPHTHRRETLFRRRQTTAVAHKKCRVREDEQLENVECRPELSETGNTIKSIAAHQIEPAPVCALEWGEKKRWRDESSGPRESRGHWTQQTRRRKKMAKMLNWRQLCHVSCFCHSKHLLEFDMASERERASMWLKWTRVDERKLDCCWVRTDRTNDWMDGGPAGERKDLAELNKWMQIIMVVLLSLCSESYQKHLLSMVTLFHTLRPTWEREMLFIIICCCLWGWEWRAGKYD